MLGAILLSSPYRARNRNLFVNLVTACARHLTDDGEPLLMVASTVAIDDEGRRAKTSSLCAPWAEIDVSVLNRYNKSFGDEAAPPFDPYNVSITDNPMFAQGFIPVDVMALGRLTPTIVPSHSTCVYSSLTGQVIAGSYLRDIPPDTLPADVLVRMAKDDGLDANFIEKARRNILEPLTGRFAAQVTSVGPDPLLILAREGRTLYLSVAYMQGSFYLIWSDFRLPALSPYCCIWPLDVFDRGAERMVLGFSLRMLRTKWVRWLTPRLERRVLPDGTTHPRDLMHMRVPFAIAALQQWVARHSSTAPCPPI